MKLGMSWIPAALLSAGVIANAGAGAQRSMPLRASLDDVVPIEIEGHTGADVSVSEAEQRIAGMDAFVMRSYGAADAPAFSVYVGYYEHQTRGHTIHSPKNCMPGSGWEALASQLAVIPVSGGSVTVNRYLLQREDERALVLYWYQGRGRIEASEYRVKLDLLRDAALRRRSDEALVRIVVPVTTTEDAALDVAVRVASTVIPAVWEALPE